MRTLPRLGWGSVTFAVVPSSETSMAPRPMREKSTSASTLPAATNSVRSPLMTEGMKRASFSMSMMSWKFPLAALKRLRSCIDCSRTGWLRSTDLVPNGSENEGRQFAKRKSAPATSASTTTTVPMPMSAETTRPHRRGGGCHRGGGSKPPALGRGEGPDGVVGSNAPTTRPRAGSTGSPVDLSLGHPSGLVGMRDLYPPMRHPQLRLAPPALWLPPAAPRRRGGTREGVAGRIAGGAPEHGDQDGQAQGAADLLHDIHKAGRGAGVAWLHPGEGDQRQRHEREAD